MVKRIAITAAAVMATDALCQCAQRDHAWAAWLRFCLGRPDNVYPAPCLAGARHICFDLAPASSGCLPLLIARLLIVLVLARFLQNTRLLNLLLEAAERAIERLVRSNLHLCQPVNPPSEGSPRIPRRPARSPLRRARVRGGEP